jgi:hypothetical protein
MNVDPVSPIPASELEKRVSRRARTKLPAKIIFGSKEFVLDCTIRDLSATGARVAIPPLDILPKTLILVEPQNMLAFDSCVRWQRNSLVGLSFNKAISLDDPLDPETRLLRMYALNARLAWGY